MGSEAFTGMPTPALHPQGPVQHGGLCTLMPDRGAEATRGARKSPGFVWSCWTGAALLAPPGQVGLHHAVGLGPCQGGRGAQDLGGKRDAGVLLTPHTPVRAPLSLQWKLPSHHGPH